MSDVKLSVIVPVYNAEATLSSTVLSLLGSSLDGTQIILVNDGSQDGSAEICDGFARNHDNVICIHKRNGGVSSARNAGLDAAMGEWIGFVDADDTIEPDAYDYLINEAERAQVDIAQFAVYLDSDGKSEITYSPKNPIKANINDKNFCETFMRFISYGSCCKIFKRSAIEGVRFDETTAIGEDLRFNLDMLAKCKEILICPKPMYHYVQLSTSATHTLTRSRLTSFRSMIKRAEIDFSDYPTLRSIIHNAVLLDASDIASKLVLSEIKDESLFGELRADIRSKAAQVIFGSGISIAQRMKLLLIAYLPGLYKRLLIKYKGKRGKN